MKRTNSRKTFSNPKFLKSVERLFVRLGAQTFFCFVFVFASMHTTKQSLDSSNVSVVANVTRWGNLLHFGELFKVYGTIILPKLPALLGKFSKGVEIFHFSCAIMFGQLL